MSNNFHKLITRLEGENGNESTEVELVSYSKDRKSGESESRYVVKHSNQKTILEQFMIINCDSSGNYTASIIFDEFPKLSTPEEAALKLADWLQRLGNAIEANFKKESE